MLAKVVATEIGANFINISMSSIGSKWSGEGEKHIKVVFSLASKISPSIILVDEVDSMLGRRENPEEHEAMRRLKNEFMLNWDGLSTKDTERVLVLAATNRPFDLEEAVIRRLPRRTVRPRPRIFLISREKKRSPRTGTGLRLSDRDSEEYERDYNSAMDQFAQNLNADEDLGIEFDSEALLNLDT
ncbi:hypothetical protein T459_27685 [Capsicum annuum]|uniref:ATPase AAA-type core domain-containing protein n=1 Tax=Capsicum annuum TaxID=4072 RepID=A0A2G2YEM5_CAPAN|nr:hypothetical protein T459_27685 [Capsicum annuum]